MSRFFSKELCELEPYTPGEQPGNTGELIKLNTNENPYGPSPKVKDVVTSSEIEKLMLYPDPEAGVLVSAIADFYGIEKDMVMVGNGSDEVLAFSFLAFQSREKKIYFPEISYGFYPVFEKVFRTSGVGIPLDEDLRIDPKEYENLDGTILIANPNAPTGIALGLSEIEKILETNHDNLVIIDEAYVDFGAESSVRLTDKYDNLLVVQTFSKSRSLAGSRLGFAVGNRELIADLNTVKYSFNPYNIDRLTILAGAASISDREYFEKTRKKVIDTREWTKGELEKLGFTVLPSSTNFIFAESDMISGEEYFNALRENNIIVRHFDVDRIRNYVRITIGTDDQMKRFADVTAEIINRK